MAETVVIIRREPNEHGNNYRDAGSFEAEVGEAIALIEEGKARAEGYSCGVVPDEWLDVDEEEKVDGVS